MLVKTAVRPFRTSLIHKLLSSVTSVSTFSEANANLLAENGIWARALEPIAPIKSYGLKSNAPHQGTVFITSQSAVAMAFQPMIYFDVLAEFSECIKKKEKVHTYVRTAEDTF